MMVDALTAIRKAIGPENFTQVMKMMPMDCGMMKSGEMVEKGEMMENKPAQEKEEDSSSEHEEHHPYQ